MHHTTMSNSTDWSSSDLDSDDGMDVLSADNGLRAAPKSFINPIMQRYWISTKYNQIYCKNMELVNELTDWIIVRQLNQQLEDITIMSDNPDESQGEDRDPSLENMVTRLMESCMEQHLSQSSSKSCPFVSTFSAAGRNSSFSSSSSSDSSISWSV